MKRLQIITTTAVIVAFAALLSFRPTVVASPTINTGMTQEAVIELKTALGK